MSLMSRRFAAVAALAAGAAVALALALAPPSALAQGCAMCKTALDGPVDPLTEAFNVSSLFLMATPYTVVGTLGAWIYLAGRRRDRQLEQDAADQAASLAEHE